MECIRDCFLYQHVKIPTHQRKGIVGNLLDLILTNEEGMVTDVTHNAPLGHSDHQSLVFNFRAYTEKGKKQAKKFKYDKGNYDCMRLEVAEYNWKELEGLSVEEHWKIFKDRLHEQMNKHIPKTSGRAAPKKRPLWMNEKALTKVRKKTEAYKRYMGTREGKDFDLYARARNQAKWACRCAVRDHESNIARYSKSNPKAFYSYANGKLKTKSSVPDLDRPQGGKTKTDREKAEVLNDFFSSVFTRENTSNIPDFAERAHKVPLQQLQATPDMVLKKLVRLKPGKAQGLDGVNPRVLIELQNELASPIADLMNKTLEKDEIPQDWKDALVSPIFKKGPKSTPGNYRPVSLTSIICKLTESIIKDHMMKHLIENDLLTPCQHGFVEGKSCTTQLLECLDIWTEILDIGGYVDVIYMDYAKAFDKVAHQRLLKKMECYGITGHVLNWTRSFLNCRRQKVAVNGEESSWSNVLSGVPQGSVLGPLLFVIYINDLPEQVHTMVRMFADDTKVFADASARGAVQEIQEDIIRLDNWAKEWQLTFNAKKCKVMYVGKKNPCHEYKMEQEGVQIELERTRVEKDLGVHIDDQLKFSDHTEIQVNKANKLLGLIRRSYTYLDKDCITTLYKTLIRPLLEYGHCITYPRFEKDRKLVEGVQRRATKMIPELRDMEYPDRLQALKLPSMQYRRERGDMIESYKFTHQKYKSDYPFIDGSESNSRGNSLRFKKSHVRTKIRQHFFSHRVINLWNSLPDEVVTAPTINTFKNRLDRHWRHFTYNLEPLPTSRMHYTEDIDKLNEQETTVLQA